MRTLASRTRCTKARIGTKFLANDPALDPGHGAARERHRRQRVRVARSRKVRPLRPVLVPAARLHVGPPDSSNDFCRGHAGAKKSTFGDIAAAYPHGDVARL